VNLGLSIHSILIFNQDNIHNNSGRQIGLKMRMAARVKLFNENLNRTAILRMSCI